MIPIIHWDIANNYSDTLTISDIITWVPRQQNLSKNAFALVIQGRSMLPEFKPDDIIYIEPEISLVDLKDGDFVIIKCDEDKTPTLKQLIIGNSQGDKYLRVVNPDWATEKMISMDECLLVGIVDSKIVRYRKQ